MTAPLAQQGLQSDPAAAALDTGAISRAGITAVTTMTTATGTVATGTTGITAAATKSHLATTTATIATAAKRTLARTTATELTVGWLLAVDVSATADRTAGAAAAVVMERGGSVAESGRSRRRRGWRRLAALRDGLNRTR